MDVATVKSRLTQLGYASTEADTSAIQNQIEQVEEHILNYCHITTVPTGLAKSELESICGRFLSQKKALGELTGYDISQGISSVNMGDTTISYSGSSQDDLFNTMLATMTNGLEGEMKCYRKLRF